MKLRTHVLALLACVAFVVGGIAIGQSRINAAERAEDARAEAARALQENYAALIADAPKGVKTTHTVEYPIPELGIDDTTLNAAGIQAQRRVIGWEIFEDLEGKQRFWVLRCYKGKDWVGVVRVERDPNPGWKAIEIDDVCGTGKKSEAGE